MKIVSFINEKGGTCKTTLTVNLAAYVALKRNKRILLIDLDSQGHAGKSLGVRVHGVETTIYELLKNPRLQPESGIIPTNIKGLDLICSNKRLADLPIDLARFRDRELRLWQVMRKLEPLGYDYIFIDSPPSLGLITTNILVASTHVVVPVALTYLALDGCAEVVGSIKATHDRVEECQAELAMVIPTLYRSTRLANEIVAKLVEYFPDRISKTILGYNVRIDEAQSFGQTIWEYDPDGKGAKMLAGLGVEIFNRVLRT
jgi:chromosome partitioning protein